VSIFAARQNVIFRILQFLILAYLNHPRFPVSPWLSPPAAHGLKGQVTAALSALILPHPLIRVPFAPIRVNRLFFVSCDFAGLRLKPSHVLFAKNLCRFALFADSPRFFLGKKGGIKANGRGETVKKG